MQVYIIKYSMKPPQIIKVMDHSYIMFQLIKKITFVNDK